MLNNNFLILLLAFLATYRLSWEFATKDGPFGIFIRFRSWVIITTAKAWIEDYLTCTICWSMLVAPVVTLVLLPHLSWREFFLVWFGLSGAVMVVHLMALSRIK